MKPYVIWDSTRGKRDRPPEDNSPDDPDFDPNEAA